MFKTKKIISMTDCNIFEILTITCFNHWLKVKMSAITIKKNIYISWKNVYLLESNINWNRTKIKYFLSRTIIYVDNFNWFLIVWKDYLISAGHKSTLPLTFPWHFFPWYVSQELRFSSPPAMCSLPDTQWRFDKTISTRTTNDGPQRINHRI